MIYANYFKNVRIGSAAIMVGNFVVFYFRATFFEAHRKKLQMTAVVWSMLQGLSASNFKRYMEKIALIDNSYPDVLEKICPSTLTTFHRLHIRIL